LASYDANSGTLTLEALDAEEEGILPIDKCVDSSIHIPASAVNDLIEVQVKECVEHNNCLVEFFPDSFFRMAKPTDEAKCYRLSCVREKQLIAIGGIQVQPGQQLRMKDLIDTYLNTAGMILQRVNAVKALRENEEHLEELVAQRTADLIAANKALQESLEKLEKTQDQLVQSEKMAALGRLVAGITHEISTPLGVGVTATSHLEEKTQEIERFYHDDKMRRSDLEDYLKTVRETTGIIMRNLQRAANHIQGFKQVAVDQTSEKKRQFKLKEYIDEVLLSLHPKLKRTPHTITVNCPENLEIDSYPGAFSQIITNFVMNSLIHGFTPDTTQGEIVLQIYENRGSLWIRYRDNGRGMSEQECTRIFEPFYTTKREQGGSGLGLHIVYNLVTQQLNGQITCESIPGVGTTFIIQIPI
jgi:signal transduction histidine kinase